MEERLAELESRVAFQDNTIQELNDVLVKQQQQINLLTSQYRELKQQLQAIEPSSLIEEAQETPPPHY